MSIPRNSTTIDWVCKMVNDYLNMDDECDIDRKCGMTMDEVMPQPFHMIHFIYPFRLTVDGYLDEKQRMSDIMIRCNHHQQCFNNDSKTFVLFIINMLYKPIINPQTTNRMHYKLNNVLMNVFDDIFDFTANGICQICAYYLATELPAFLIKLNKYKIKDNTYCIDMICNLLLLILQYPSLSMLYLKHKTIWKYIMYYFKLLCYGNKYDEETNNTENIQSSYRNLAIFGNQILRNGILMKKSKYWKKNVYMLMEYIIHRFKVECKRREIMDLAATSMLNIYWMIELYLYYIGKSENKSDVKLQEYLDDLVPILDNICRNGDNYNAFLVKELISHLFEIVYKGEIIWVIKAQQTVWRMKRNHMKCLWYKCDKKAKQSEKNRLNKCKKCKVARYCSKRCQKLDWNIGHHKKLCLKLCKL